MLIYFSILLFSAEVFSADFYVANPGSGTSCTIGQPCNINNVPYVAESKVNIASSGSNYSVTGVSISTEKYQYVGTSGPASTFIYPAAVALGSGNAFEISGTGSIDFSNVTVYCVGCDTLGCVGFSKFLVWLSGDGSCGCLNVRIIASGSVSHIIFGATRGNFSFMSSSYSGNLANGATGLFQFNSTTSDLTQYVVMEDSVFENISMSSPSSTSLVAGIFGTTLSNQNILNWSFTRCRFNNITVGESSANGALIVYPNSNQTCFLNIVDSNFTTIIHNVTGLIYGLNQNSRSSGNITNCQFLTVSGKDRASACVFIRSDWGNWTVFDSRFENCTTLRTAEGGVVWTQWVYVIFQNTIFRLNDIANFGGAIFITGNNGAERRKIIYCTFEHNKAKRGGAIYSTMSFTVSNCVFKNNTATEGETFGMDIFFTYTLTEAKINTTCLDGEENRFSHNGNDVTYLVNGCSCNNRNPGNATWGCQIPSDTFTCDLVDGGCVAVCPGGCQSGYECVNGICTVKKCDDMDASTCSLNTSCELQNSECKRKCNPTCGANYNCVDSECVVKSCPELTVANCLLNQNCFVSGGACATCAGGTGCGELMQCNTAGTCVPSPCDARTATDTTTLFAAEYGVDGSKCGPATSPCRHVAFAASTALKSTGKVIVEPGTFEETTQIVVEQHLTVKGAGKYNTKLTKGNCVLLFSVRANSNLTVTKMTLLTTNCAWNTGFFHTNAANTWIRLIVCRITPKNAGGTMGEGFIYAENTNANILLDQCNFFNMISTANKPFIGSDITGSFIVNSSSFVNMQSTHATEGGFGSCFVLLNVSNISVSNTQFINCRSVNHRGVCHVQLRVGGSFLFDSCEFWNVSSATGGVSIGRANNANNPAAIVKNCTHVDCVASQNSAAYRLTQVSSFTLAQSTFIRCLSSSENQDGGVILVTASASLSIDSCLFLNSSAFRGGVLGLDGTSATILNSVFRGSIATGGQGSDIVITGNIATITITNSFSSSGSSILNTVADTTISGSLGGGSISCVPTAPTSGACSSPCVTTTGSNNCVQGDNCPNGFLPSHGKCVPQCAYTVPGEGGVCPDAQCPLDSTLGYDLCASIIAPEEIPENSLCGSYNGQNCFFFPRASETGTHKCDSQCQNPAFVGDADQTVCFFVRCQDRTPTDASTWRCGELTEVPQCLYDPSARECTLACSTNNNHLTGNDVNPRDGTCDPTVCNVRQPAGVEEDVATWRCGFPGENPPCYWNLGRDELNATETVCATSCSDSKHYAVNPEVNNGACEFQDCTTRIYTTANKCGLNCIYDPAGPADRPCVAECNRSGLHDGESNGVCILKLCEDRSYEKNSLFPCGPDVVGTNGLMTPCLWDPLSIQLGQCSKTCADPVLYQPTSYRKCDTRCSDRVADPSLDYPCGSDGCLHDPGTLNGCSTSCSYPELFVDDPTTGRCIFKNCVDRLPSEYLSTAPCGTKDCYRDMGSDANRCVLNCSNTYWYEKGPNGDCITKPNCGGDDPTYDGGVGDDGVRVGEQWLDTKGKPVQAHGGDFLQKDGVFYWVGENHAYCGTDFIHLALYSSTDLIHWEFIKDLVTWWTRWQNDGDKLICDIGGKRYDYCTVERPAFLYNELTHRYVIWAHFEENGVYEWWNESEAQHVIVLQSSEDNPASDYTVVFNARPGVGHVAVSCVGDPTYDPTGYAAGGYDPYSPSTPFLDGSWVNDSVVCKDAWGGPRPHPYPWGYSSKDFTVFEDPASKEAYLVSDQGNTLRVYVMSNDYLNLDWANSYSLNAGLNRESPALAKKDDVFFLITSQQRGFLPTQSRYQTTSNLKKPANAAAAAAMGILWDGNADTWGNTVWSDLKYIGSSTTFNSEPAEIVAIMDYTNSASPVEQFVYLGDRWNTTDIGKSTYVWLPLTLDSIAKTARLDFTTEWTINVNGRIVKNELENLSTGKTTSGTNVITGTCPYDQLSCAPQDALDGNWNTYDDFSTDSFFRGSVFPYAWTVDLGDIYSVQRIDIQYFERIGSEVSTYATVYGATTGNDWVAIADSHTVAQYGFVSYKVSGYFRYIKIDVEGNSGWGADWESGLVEAAVWGMPRTCEQRTKVDYNVTHPCGPDVGSGGSTSICYWDEKSSNVGRCSLSCTDTVTYEKVDSRRSCLMKCNLRTPDPTAKYPCGNDRCYEDPNGSEGKSVCTPDCSTGSIFLGDDKTGKCILRNCTDRGASNLLAPCGTLDCYADVGFNDSKCVENCTNSGMYEKGNAGSCIPKPNCVEDDPTYDGSKGDFGIRNGEQWLDTRGKPIQAHGGSFFQKDGKYYWIGENRAHCNTDFIHVSLYVSDDMVKWEYKKELLNADTRWQNDPTMRICDLAGKSFNCTVQRPALLYNALTSRYVIYAHWEENGVYEWWNESVAAHILIAQSADDDPESEFTVVFNGRPGVGHVATACVGDPTYDPNAYQNGAADPATPGVPYISGSFINNSINCYDAWGGDRPHPYPWGYFSSDFAVFEDPDSGEAYLVSDQGSTLRVYTLNADYLGLDWQRSYPLNAGQELESPALAKKDGVFFLLSSHKRGWNMAQTRYQTTANLKMPTAGNAAGWAQANAVAWDGNPDHWGDAAWSELKYLGSQTTYNTEPSEIVALMDNTDPASPVEQFLYLGDRWNSTDLGKSTYVWLPIDLDTTNQIATLEYTTEWTITKSGKILKNDLQPLTRGKSCSGEPLVVGNCPYDLGNCGCAGALNSVWNVFSNSAENSYFRAAGYPWSWTVDLSDIYSVQRIDIQYFVQPGSEVSVYATVYGSTNTQDWQDIANSRTQPQYGFVSYKVGGYFRYISINVTGNTGWSADWESGLVEVAVFGMPQACAQRTKVDFNETFPCGPDVGTAGCFWDPESSNSGRCATECTDLNRYDLEYERRSCMMKCNLRTPDPLLRYPCQTNDCLLTSSNTCTRDCTSDGFGYCLPDPEKDDSSSKSKMKTGTVVAIVVVVVVVVLLAVAAGVTAFIIIRRRRIPIGKKQTGPVEDSSSTTKAPSKGSRSKEADVLEGANHTLYDGNNDEVSLDEDMEKGTQPGGSDNLEVELDEVDADGNVEEDNLEEEIE